MKIRMTLRAINHPALLGTTQPLWLQALNARETCPSSHPFLQKDSDLGTPDATSSVFSAFGECNRLAASQDEAGDLTVQSDDFLNV